MEIPTGQQSKTEFWTLHIQAAQRFDGTNKEYCKLHGLNPGSLSSYRNKLGFSKPRKKAKVSGFSQVKVSLPAANQPAPLLPDPVWLAEFLKAWRA